VTFYIEEALKQNQTVHIQSCTGVARRIVQWYLMGGRVSNEGFGNEVIFDLGEVSPIGPIPPVPGINWGGGYVEDPFKGAGYVPSEENTGFDSPSADQWVRNVRMYWNNASEPFTGGQP
jgi:hypothetical protein